MQTIFEKAANFFKQGIFYIPNKIFTKKINRTAGVIKHHIFRYMSHIYQVKHFSNRLACILHSLCSPVWGHLRIRLIKSNILVT